MKAWSHIPFLAVTVASLIDVFEAGPHPMYDCHSADEAIDILIVYPSKAACFEIGRYLQCNMSQI